MGNLIEMRTMVANLETHVPMAIVTDRYTVLTDRYTVQSDRPSAFVCAIDHLESKQIRSKNQNQPFVGLSGKTTSYEIHFRALLSYVEVLFELPTITTRSN